MNASCLPSGEKRNAVMPPLCDVTTHASPPSEGIIQTCRSPSFSRSLRNANNFPSGDHSGAFALFSPRVYWRAPVPDIGVTQICVTVFHSLSFSVFVSLAVYATRVPSGAMRGAPMFTTFIRSKAVNNFFPFFARGSEAGEVIGFVSSAVAWVVRNAVITVTTSKTASVRPSRGARRSDFISNFLLMNSVQRYEWPRRSITRRHGTQPHALPISHTAEAVKMIRDLGPGTAGVPTGPRPALP